MNRQNGQSRHLLVLHIRRPGDTRDDAFDGLCEFCKRIQIIPVDFESNVRAHARDQFVKPHFDRLGDLILAAGNLLDRVLQFAHEGSFRLAGIGPFLARFQDNERVGDAGWNRVGCDFWRADLGEHALDFRQLFDAPLEHFLHLDGLGKAGARNA